MLPFPGVMIGFPLKFFSGKYVSGEMPRIPLQSEEHVTTKTP
eukprot:CAMPEP_0172923190 /NCGR_PEP_ID=MMETSP1075-20121228/209266_1 /TAXON_ID=2916 /ORGANISM="Ceratium fusus, Strain PA161109" /LENGTH=41 /DNA_ID= /DNA_START= /DNA_END= /DNA_ORIENTATION=